MMTLGIDPGTADMGWAVVENGVLLAHGQYTAPKGEKWKFKRDQFLQAYRDVLSAHPGVCVVAVEKTQVSGRADDDKSAAAVFSMAVNTQRTEELSGAICVAATAAGRQTVRVTPQASLRALSCRHGATDRQVTDGFKLLTGENLLVKQHHEARALGVALHGERAAQLMEATG